MRQTLRALLLLCLLAAFGGTAQACEHGDNAGPAATHQTHIADADTAAPQPPAHCPPASACKLHFCCTPPLVKAGEPASFVLAYTPAHFAPAVMSEPQPTEPGTLEKPPKSTG